MSADFVEAAMTSLRNKETILTDINMVKYGITQYEGEVECFIKNEEVKNVDLWKRLLAAKEPHQISFFWVKGHNGHPENERCDFLATSAADGDELMVDPGV